MIERAVPRRDMTPVTPDAPDAPGSGVPALPTSLLLLLAALSACITAQGGYYSGGQLVTGVLLIAGLFSAVRAQPLSIDDLRFGPVLAAFALAAWTLVVATIVGGAAVPVLAMLAGIVAVLLICRRTSTADRDGLAAALLGIGVLVALSGWVGVAWRLEPLTLEDQDLWRAATTLTYSNAAAGLLVSLVLLSLGRQMSRPSSALRAVVTCLLLVGAGATLSRGGGMALVAGLVALAVLAGIRPATRALAPASLGALVAVAGLALSMPNPAAVRPAVSALALAAGLAVTVLLQRAPALVRSATVALVLLVATVGLLGPLDGTRRSITGARLSLASSDRSAQTSAALDLVAERPLTGTGPGRATLFFAGPDGEPLAARYAHNEYLQMLAELGAVGLALVLVLAGTIARAVRAGRASASSPQLWAGAAAGLVALAVHSGFDFLWHVPALPFAGALLVGLTISATKTKEHA
ncbi:MAG: O-antigen ligase family protein [Acidimicrobiales bacterium]